MFVNAGFILQTETLVTGGEDSLLCLWSPNAAGVAKVVPKQVRVDCHLSLLSLLLLLCIYWACGWGFCLKINSWCLLGFWFIYFLPLKMFLCGAFCSFCLKLFIVPLSIPPPPTPPPPTPTRKKKKKKGAPFREKQPPVWHVLGCRFTF